MIAVRPAAEADVPALARLLAELGYAADDGAAAQRLDQARRSGEVYVATDGAEVVGFASCFVAYFFAHGAPWCRLTALAVDPDHRRRGVGRVLVAAVEQHAAGQGCAVVELTSRRERPEAHGFYPVLHYEASERSVRYLKELNSPGR